MITIVDYGMGNIGSLLNMCNRIGIKAQVADNINTIKDAQKIILPGVGAYDAAMKNINTRIGIRKILDIKALKEKIPVLGICLGMQLLTDSSEEGSMSGLGWISGKTLRFPKKDKLKVPHMGWNTISIKKKNFLTKNLEKGSKFYFVHSYYVEVADNNHKVLSAKHGIEFAASIEMDNILGVQFHPEKSHRFGMTILKNFSDI